MRREAVLRQQCRHGGCASDWCSVAVYAVLHLAAFDATPVRRCFPFCRHMLLTLLTGIYACLYSFSTPAECSCRRATGVGSAADGWVAACCGRSSSGLGVACCLRTHGRTAGGRLAGRHALSATEMHRKHQLQCHLDGEAAAAAPATQVRWQPLHPWAPPASWCARP